MAQIDTSIYGQFQPPKINSPFENAAMMSQLQTGQSQNRLAQMKFAEAEREGVERNALAGIAKQYGNTPEFGNKLYEGGFYKEGRDQDDYAQKRATAKTAGQKAQFEFNESQRTAAAQRFGSLRGQPYAAVVQDMQNGLREAVSSGMKTQEEAEELYAQMLPTIPRDQAGLDAFIDQKIKSVMTPKDLFAAGNPQGADSPSTVREWQFYNSLPPQEQARFIEMKRAAQIMNLGGTQAVRGPHGGIAESYPVTPKQEDMPAFKGAQAAAVATASADAARVADTGKKTRTADALVSTIDSAEAILRKGMATGSLVGAGVAAAKGAVGYSDASTQNNRQLKLISGWMVANVPRMEGPQSNFDVENYREMAATVGDSRVPVGDRLASLKQLRLLQTKYTAVNSGNAAPGKTAPAPQAAIDMLRNNPALGPQFKSKYGYLP